MDAKSGEPISFCSIENLESEPEGQIQPERTDINKTNWPQKLTARFRLKAVSTAEVLFLVSFVVVPLSVHASGVLGKFSNLLTGQEFLYERAAASQNAAEVKLLSARTSPDPTSHRGGGNVLSGDGALMSAGPFVENDSEGVSNGEISVHIVRPCTEERCETLSHIAEMYGVSVNTILWANDIRDPKLVRPGDTLVILPITGVRHVIKDKETLASIAKKYGADNSEQVEAMVSDILAYNRLASASDIKVGDTVVVPGGVIHTASPAKTPAKGSTPTKTTSSSGGSVSGGGFVHPVPGAVRTQGIHGYNAVDLAAAIGTSIRAAAAGEVIVSKSGGWNGGYGNYIVVKHANGTQTLYAHTSRNLVGVGAKVESGEIIAQVGNSGQSTGAHLHFEVRGASNPF